jgi:hypothetical protein
MTWVAKQLPLTCVCLVSTSVGASRNLLLGIREDALRVATSDRRLKVFALRQLRSDKLLMPDNSHPSAGFIVLNEELRCNLEMMARHVPV